LLKARQLQIVRALQTDPEFCGGPKETGQAKAVSALTARLPARIAVIRLTGTCKALASA
jgi:hypothetical protein